MPKNQKAVTERTGGRHGDQPFNDKRNQSAKVGIQFHVGCAAYIADTLGVEAKNLLGRRMATCADKIGPYRPVRSYRGGRGTALSFVWGFAPSLIVRPARSYGERRSAVVPRMKKAFEKLPLPVRPAPRSGAGRTGSDAGRTRSGAGRTRSGAGRTRSGAGRTKRYK